MEPKITLPFDPTVELDEDNLKTLLKETER